MITTADTRQAIDLAIEAEDSGVSVERLARVNGIDSERIVTLACGLREYLDEVHDELHRIGAAQGFTTQEVDQVFYERLAAMIKGNRQVH
jgi:chromosome segregation and condensation protein ScpB